MAVRPATVFGKFVVLYIAAVTNQHLSTAGFWNPFSERGQH